jgi:DNA gyrase subunit B
VLEGTDLARLVDVLAKLERGLTILERRGIELAKFLQRLGPAGLPTHRVRRGEEEYWFYSAQEMLDWQKQQQESGKELVVADESLGYGRTNGHTNGGGAAVIVATELHEVKPLNGLLEELKGLKLSTEDLVPLPRIAGREPPVRYFLENGDHKHPLLHLRDLVGEVRQLGQKGLTIMRFKGLGEMDPEELWETTLDPKQRTLMKVRLEDAREAEADEMFRDLMGEKVEPRREFIQKHALEARDYDYHGA